MWEYKEMTEKAMVEYLNKNKITPEHIIVLGEREGWEKYTQVYLCRFMMYTPPKVQKKEKA